MIKRALISVSDKTGVIELGKALKHFQVEILSTGGTAKTLNDAGVETISISDYTGFPEMMEGRLKTLHPRVHGALLGKRDNPEHLDAAKTYGIEWIDLVVVNLYPFEKYIESNKKPSWEELIEQIDIGGPAMIRAAAKNHKEVTVVVDPRQYKKLISLMKENPSKPFSQAYRYQMATRAFHYTSVYDSVVAQSLSGYHLSEDGTLEPKEFPEYHSIHGKLIHPLRYGENPHQKAAAYKLIRPKEYRPFTESLQGKALSFNNFLDVDAAWKILLELPPKSCAILKHNNPCGVGLGATEKESFDQAWAADPESAFGGVVGISGHVDAVLAKSLTESFFEIICAESFGVEAREIFQEKKNLRLITFPEIKSIQEEQMPLYDFRKLQGAYLVQDYDFIGAFSDFVFGPDFHCVTERQATDEERQALRLAWVVSKNVKSNSVVIANQTQSLGIGCGDVNRKFATKDAVDRSLSFQSAVKVAGSDGFFPFPDSIELLKTAGVQSIVQPGGSIRDQQVIDACNEAGISMYFTKIRHFRH